MSAPILAEMFPAGEMLADELDARGWTQADFAEVLGRPAQFVSEIISGKKEITRESATQIAAALGTTAQFWLNLQDSYLLWKQSQDTQARETLDAVKIRAKLRELAPVSLLIKRGYVKATEPREQAQEILHLFGMRSFDDAPTVDFAARRSNGEENVTATQRAWVACVKATAGGLRVAPYSKDSLESLAGTLSASVRDPSAFANFQASFAAVGVKLIYVAAFPGGRLDGCAMMVDGSPVIGISGRGKRLDKVLFTLLHEVAHVVLGHVRDDGEAIVDDLTDGGSAGAEDPTDSQVGSEVDADRLAGSLAISAPLPVVPTRVSAAWIRQHSERLDVHPIVLIGRLQNERKLSWKTTLAREAPTVTPYLESWKAPLPA